ncbi:PTS sugar transporter subunit IIA [Otariodibacter oris]|uniref:Phosphotransferase IIA-like nitrogen-regulatory protein PtsN n=1 Tax=Otariodibacter oris TaxID=1032623 RepID=A0A420XID2_9PAST|nr:PTS sugar transporter subunit IIA [Otariodibacter oris]QGM80981.1 PTS sugar transporter subunit IIA [Otariodibacter oris]RKR76840.1 phosphotransferase IIA-like nitrogen-regulatory protein PtsN [Otariodibacter oris]
MKLTEFLSPERIYPAVALSSKKRVLEFIAKVVADSFNHMVDFEKEEELASSSECFNYLVKREKLGSTAINNGVAIPHARLPLDYATIDKPIAIFVQLENPIDYDSNDHKNVDLVYAILFPESCCTEYKDYLSKVAQRLSDKNILKHLRASTSSEDIWQVLSYSDQHTQEDEMDSQLENNSTEEIS